MGSIFFIGVISTVLIIPPLSDRCCGRKAIFIGGVIVYIIAYIGIICSTNIYEFYVFQFLNGASYASKVIVGLNYLTEFIPSYKQDIMVYMFLLVEPFTIIFLTFWYQMIDRHWFNIALIFLILICAAVTYFYFFVPESAKWLMTWRMYETARESLSYVAKYNGNN